MLITFSTTASPAVAELSRKLIAIGCTVSEKKNGEDISLQVSGSNLFAAFTLIEHFEAQNAKVIKPPDVGGCRK